MNALTRPKLQTREKRILAFLARGWSYPQIAKRLEIRDDCLHVHCHHIRQKTGIKNTRDAEECHHYVRNVPDHYIPPVRRPLSWTQKEVLELIALGDDYARIARTLGIGKQTAQNHASAACKRAGIDAKGHYARTKAIKEYVAQVNAEKNATTGEPVNDPMF